MADPQGVLRIQRYDPRGVLLLDEHHVPRRLQRWLRQCPYRITHNQAFAEVVLGCAERVLTWINRDIIESFCELHEAGLGHSLEAWEEDRLVGGLYGLSLGATFCGESMFHRAPQASKACLAELLRRLKKGGFELIDCQDVTPTLAQFGARWMPFEEYFERFRRNREKKCCLHA